MKNNVIITFVIFITINALLCQAKERKVEIISDNDADTMVSKIYIMKNTKSSNILPYVTDAVKSAMGSADSVVADVTAFRYGMDDQDALMVTMKKSMITDIDKLISDLDNKGFDGSGLFQFEHILKYRHKMDFFVKFANLTSPYSRWRAIDGEKIIFKASKGYGILGKKWLKRFDQLVPRSELTFNVYEVSEDNITDIGVDYTAWLSDVHAGTIEPFRQTWKFINTRDTSPDWSNTQTTDFIFNGSYLRMLQQKGIANLATSGSIMVKNNMGKLTSDPNYSAELSLVSNYNGVEVSEVNIKCLPHLYSNSDYSELSWSITANNNSNIHSMISKAKLVDNQEKILFAYNRKHDVTQYNGMPFLGDIPYLKYLFGDEIHSKINSRVFVTVTVKPIQGSNIEQKHQDIISKSESIRTELKEAK